MAGRRVQGSGPGLQGVLSRSASTQKLTTILGVGAFYTLNMVGNHASGGVMSLRVTPSGGPNRFWRETGRRPPCGLLNLSRDDFAWES